MEIAIPVALFCCFQILKFLFNTIYILILI